MEPRMVDHDDYKVYWNPTTGMTVRGNRSDGTRPEMSSKGPELADIHITDYCPMTCDYCYRESDPSKSTHMSVQNFATILEDMSPWVLQIAIGGGSPQHHPQFIELLRTAHEKGIVPSYTSNGLDMTPEILEASKRYCGAVAISMHNETLAIQKVREMLEYGIPTGIHVILSRDKIDHWAVELAKANRGEGLLGSEPDLYSCIFLMQKPIGRASWEQHPTIDQKLEFMQALQQYKGKVAVGIDSCASSSFVSRFPVNARAASALKIERAITDMIDHAHGMQEANDPRLKVAFAMVEDYAHLYAAQGAHSSEVPVPMLGPCDSGCFSVFVDEHLKVSPCSFNKQDIYSLEDQSFREIWDRRFETYREQVFGTCPDCESRTICRSCQVIPRINPCKRETRTI